MRSGARSEPTQAQPHPGAPPKSDPDLTRKENMTASSHGKTVSNILDRRAGARLGWREVLAAIQDAPERSGLVAALVGSGFSLDDFARLIKPREIACDWLGKYEDRLEPLRGKTREEERARVRIARRRLELELFP